VEQPDAVVGLICCRLAYNVQ